MEPRDFYEMNEADMAEYCGGDGRKWAEAFCKIKECQGWSSDDIDIGLMTGWFASAIERSSALRLSAQQREPVVRVKDEHVSALQRALEPFSKYEVHAIGYGDAFSKDELEDFAWVIGLSGPQPEFRHFEDAKRIMAAIEITRSDHTSKSTAARTDAGKTGVTAGETATTSDGGSPGPSPLAVKPGSSDPASGRSQPSPNVSVGELADFIGQLDILSIFVNSDDETAEIARAMLARYRIERLDRLASSGRR